MGSAPSKSGIRSVAAPLPIPPSSPEREHGEDASRNKGEDSTKPAVTPFLEDPDSDSSGSSLDLLGTLSEADMVKELDKLLNTHTQLYQRTRHFWTLKQNQSEEFDEKLFRKHVSNLCDSYFYFRDEQFSLRLRLQYTQKAAQNFVSSGNVPVLCDLILEILQKKLYYTENESTKKRRPDFLQGHLLTRALTTLWNFTDNQQVTCLAVIDHGKFLPDLVHQLETFRNLHIKGELNMNAEELTVTAGLSILHNVGMHEENVQHMRSLPGFMDLLKAFITMDHELWKFFGIVTLADVVSDAEADALTTTSDVLEFLLSCVKDALNDDMHQAHISGTGASAGELIQAVKHLSRNDANSRLLVEKGALPLLAKGLKSDLPDERKVCIESLWWLSFLKENREKMAARQDLLDLVAGVYGNKDDPCHSAAEGMLFQLRDNLRQHHSKKYSSLVEQLQGDHDTPAVATSGHVMLSYTRVNREVVKMVCDYLKNNGIRVWMDIYNMAEGESSTTQTMAEAVEGSFIFLMCVSESYKNSQYCRQEAEYAFENQKQIIPLKLQREYRPDGWLGFIQGSKFFYDFSQPEFHKDKLLRLLTAIKKAHAVTSKDAVDGPIAMETAQKVQAERPVVIDTSHGGMSYASPGVSVIPVSAVQQIRQWKKEDVTKWLHKFDLKGKSLEALTGLEIVFLRQINDRAPECFYQLLTSQLHLKTVVDMAKLTYALEEVHTML